MHLLSTKKLEHIYTHRILTIASDIEKCPERYTTELDGKILANLFFEKSTRTEMSFETAMYKLGGKVISPNVANSSLGKGESMENMVKTISQYVDAIVIRHPIRNLVSDFALHSDVPVINGGDGDNEHPTQALLDWYTILKSKGHKITEKINLMFTGDIRFSRTIRSLLWLLPNNIKIYFANNISDLVVPNNLDYSVIQEDSIPSYLPDMDILYMTRNQLERHDGRLGRYTVTEFIMTPKLADKMKPDAVIMHPLPATKELPVSMNSHPKSWYFKQAKNGLWVRMAILWEILHKKAEK